ncbi:hypothetical protein D3C71_1276700 [compost metagenome]
MTRHVDFRHHANTTRGGVAHHVAHLFWGVEQPVAGELRQFRVALRGKPPALIVRQMPVQDVELRRRHAIDLAFDVLQRDEMARRIEQ